MLARQPLYFLFANFPCTVWLCLTVLYTVGHSKERPRENKSLYLSKRDYITFGYPIVLSFSSVSGFLTLLSVELFSQQWLLAGMLTRVLVLATYTRVAAAPKGSSTIGIPTRSALFTSIEAITTGLKKTIMPTPHPGALCVLDFPVIIFASGWPHTNWCIILDQQQWQLRHATLVPALALHTVVSHRQLCQTAWLDST